MRCGRQNTVALAQRVQARALHVPGWKTLLSTKDARTREQRETDRKRRQLEKLPKPLALHEPEYPYLKTVLADHWFQPPVYETELDTPHLFDGYPPTDFVLRWNVSDFDRSAFPDVPAEDSRHWTSDAFRANEAHQKRVRQYLRKHLVVPDIFPATRNAINLACTFPQPPPLDGAADAPAPVEAPGPEGAMSDIRTFWHAAHYGNYIPLDMLQDAPEIHIGADDANSDALYTVMMFCPDYPSRAKPHEGFFLHYAVANVKAGAPVAQNGTVVVPYVPPLPTEDAGAPRHVLAAFKQSGPLKLPTIAELPFAVRSNYVMHDARPRSAALKSDAAGGKALEALEGALGVEPEAVTFFTTKWDIQVQQWYEGNNLPEPMYSPDDVDELVATFDRPLDWDRIKSRRLADGSVNAGEQLRQRQQSLEGYDTALAFMSKRTLMTKDKKLPIYPKKKGFGN